MPHLELPKNWMPKLDHISLHISDIEYECATWKVPKVSQHAGYIKFTGIYKHGSRGREDAKYIDWRIKEFCDLVSGISGLIVDFRTLDYRWGDNLRVSPPEQFDRRGLPVYILVPSRETHTEIYEAYVGILGEYRLRTDIRAAFYEMAQAVAQRKGW